MILLTDTELATIARSDKWYSEGHGLQPLYNLIAKTQARRMFDYLDIELFGTDRDGLKLKVTPYVAMRFWEQLRKEIEL